MADKPSTMAADGSLELVEVAIGQYHFDMQLPAGSRFELLSHQLEAPRIMHFAGQRLLIGSRSGKVYWLDPPYTRANVLVALNGYPHSVVVLDDILYVAQTDGIYAADYRGQPATLAAAQFRRLLALPGGRGHNSRTLKIGPDRRLYVSLGISGNCSDEYLHRDRPPGQRRGGVVDLTASPPQLVPFSSGLRNPVGFDWHPQTRQLYASNNGPDHAGFDEPPEVFARLTQQSFHGMPWYQFDRRGALVRDDCITTPAPLAADDVTRPVATFAARVAPMDVTFVPESDQFADYSNDALVALHGSWATSNQGRGDGDPASRRPPAIVRVVFDQGQVQRVENFITGFQLDNGARWLRPIGLIFAPDGSLLITSDDGIQGLYRLSGAR